MLTVAMTHKLSWLAAAVKQDQYRGGPQQVPDGASERAGAGDRREPDGFRRACLREYCRFDTQARIPGDKFSYALNQRLPEDIGSGVPKKCPHLPSQKDGQHKDV